MADRIQLRRDSAAAWTLANPVLADGEIGWERDTYQFKVGNGTSTWNSLAYGGIQGPSGAADAFLIANRFNEIAADEVAKADARTNLGLSTIDGGTFT